jgi:hypothetical protein
MLSILWIYRRDDQYANQVAADDPVLQKRFRKMGASALEGRALPRVSQYAQASRWYDRVLVGVRRLW